MITMHMYSAGAIMALLKKYSAPKGRKISAVGPEPDNNALHLTRCSNLHSHQAFEMDGERNLKKSHKDPMFCKRI